LWRKKIYNLLDSLDDIKNGIDKDMNILNNIDIYNKNSQTDPIKTIEEYGQTAELLKHDEKDGLG
jgi:hypothetical protein